MRWRVGIERKRAGAAAWSTPDILTLPEWLERCWENSLVKGGSAGQRLLLSDAQFRHVSRQIIDEISGDQLQGSGIERLVRQARTVSAHWHISPRDLHAAMNNPDTEFYSAWAERFEAMCTEHRWVDAAGLLNLLTPELPELLGANKNRVVLAGFEHPTATEKRLFEQLDVCGKLAGQLAVSAPVTTAGYQLKFSEPAEERRAAACWARERLAAQPDALIGIIVQNLSRASGAYRRDFLNIFDPLWRERSNVLHPVSVVDGRRLVDTGMVRTALILLRVPYGKLSFEELGWLLRSPYVGEWPQEIDERARFDLSIRNDGLQTVSLRTLQKRFCRPEEPGPRKFLALIEAMLGLADQIQEAREPIAWATVFDQLLGAAGFCRGRSLSPRDDKTSKQWDRLIEGFSSMGEVTGRIGYRTALALLDTAAREQPCDVMSRDDGVHIMAPADANSIAFDAVWLCGMTSAAWPGDSRPSPLIPMGLQRDRKIPEAWPDLYRARSLDQLRLLLTGSPESIASWSALDGEETLLPSPHIAHLDPVSLTQLGIDRDTQSVSVQSGVMTEVADDVPAVTAEERIRGGSRLLTLQSVCPARAFFELRLGAKEMPLPPFALDAMTRGSLVHDAAEFLYAGLGDRPWSSSENDVKEVMGSAINRALDRHIPPMHPLAETLRATEGPRIERLLCDLLEFDRSRGSISVKNIENKQKITVGDVELTVRFDRVDADDDDGRFVIDYKTGSKFSVSKWLGERPREMQMPLYAAYGDFDGIALCWLHASGITITGMGDRDWGFEKNRSFRVQSADEWQAQVSEWREICETLLDEFRGGDVRIDVENDGPAAGDYAMLTRRWTLRIDLGQDAS